MDASQFVRLLVFFISTGVQCISPKAGPTCISDGNYVLNACGDRCDYRNGTLQNCYRIRKEFTSMSFRDRERFIEVYKIVGTHSLFKKRYEQLVNYHIQVSDKTLHHTEYIFLPWHRWWLLEWENLLRRVDCRLTIPFWDWSRVAEHWWRSSHEEDFWNPGSHGFGGDGEPPDYCVTDGPFRKELWTLTRSGLSECLTRNFSYDKRLISTSEAVNRSLQLPLSQFSTFEEIVRTIFHSDIHDWIGGTMRTPRASNAPEILPHHAFIDMIWSKWQNKGQDFKTVYFRSVNRKLPLSENFPWQLLDNDNLPGGVKVLYEQIPNSG